MEKKQFEVVRPNLYSSAGDIYFSSRKFDLFNVLKDIYEVVKKNIGILRDRGSNIRRGDLRFKIKEFENLRYSDEKLHPPFIDGQYRFDLGYVITAGTAFADEKYNEWQQLLKIKEKTQRQKRRIITLEKKIPKNCAYLNVLEGKPSSGETRAHYIGFVTLVNINKEHYDNINRTKDELLG